MIHMYILYYFILGDVTVYYLGLGLAIELTSSHLVSHRLETQSKAHMTRVPHAVFYFYRLYFALCTWTVLIVCPTAMKCILTFKRFFIRWQQVLHCACLVYDNTNIRRLWRTKLHERYSSWNLRRRTHRRKCFTVHCTRFTHSLRTQKSVYRGNAFWIGLK